MTDDIVFHLRREAQTAIDCGVGDGWPYTQAADEIERLRARGRRDPVGSPAVSGDIVERLRNWDDGRVSTHYEGCWDSHPVCAILLAASIIEQRDADLAAERAECDEQAALVTAWRGVADGLAKLVPWSDRLAARAEIERLRAAGDALADNLRRHQMACGVNDASAAVAAWEEARRER